MEGSDVGNRDLLVAAGRNPQSLVLDHFYFFYMCGGHLSEPDRVA